MKSFIYVLAAILIFSLLVAVHEFGHFIAAKLCGVKVNEFSIGMGPALWSRQRGETQYSLRALPIGGYCALEGEDEDTGDQRSLNRQGFWKKILIFAAGALMNFLTGLVIILILYSRTAVFYSDQLTGVAPEFPYQGESGFMAGDQIYKVNGYRTYFSQETQLFLSYARDTADVEVVRDGVHIALKDLPRRTYTSTDGSTYQGFGLYVGTGSQEADFLLRLKYSWYQAMDFVQIVWFSLVQLVTGGVSVQELSGPVGIVGAITEVGNASKTVWIAVENIAYMAALIAVNLAVMNLLPLPALDGGRIFFLLVDQAALLLFRRKVPEKYQAAINTAGFVVLMGFMLLVTFQDVFKLLN